MRRRRGLLAPPAAPVGPDGRSAAARHPPGARPRPPPRVALARHARRLRAGQPGDHDRRQADDRHGQPGLPAVLRESGRPATDPWELGDPTNGEGFESAFAYALADAARASRRTTSRGSSSRSTTRSRPGQGRSTSTSTRSRTARASPGRRPVRRLLHAQPGGRRAQGNAIASAKTIADLKAFKLGAQVGTTSLDTINNVIVPTTEPKVYNTNDDAIAGAATAKQIDGIVVDLPTAFYVTGAQVENCVDRRPVRAPTAPTRALQRRPRQGQPADRLRQRRDRGASRPTGRSTAITTEWLSDKASAPVIQP